MDNCVFLFFRQHRIVTNVESRRIVSPANPVPIPATTDVTLPTPAETGVAGLLLGRARESTEAGCWSDTLVTNLPIAAGPMGWDAAGSYSTTA